MIGRFGMVDAFMNYFLNSKVAKYRKGQAPIMGSGYNVGGLTPLCVSLVEARLR